MIIFISNSSSMPSMKLYSEGNHRDMRSSNNYSTILNIMSYTGIDLFGQPGTRSSTTATRVIGIFVAVLLHLSSVDYLIMSYINLGHHWEEYQVVLSLMLSNTISLALWHILHYRRKSLKILIERMRSISDGVYVISSFEKSVVDLAVVFSLFILPITYSIVSTYLMIANDPYAYHAFYTYGLEERNVTTSVYGYFFAKVLSTSLLDPIFVSCVTFVYCLLCHRSWRLLSEYRKRLVKLLKSRNEPSTESLHRMVSDYGRICHVLGKLQCIFSLPTFLMTIVDSMSSFTILASALLYSPEEYTGPVIAENVFIFVTSAWLLMATISCAARIPIEMVKVRNCFQRLQEKVLVLNNHRADKSNVRLLQYLKERPLIVLSGCEIIYFTRVTILSALGTLFTYGLLIIQLKGESK